MAATLNTDAARMVQEIIDTHKEMTARISDAVYDDDIEQLGLDADTLLFALAALPVSGREATRLKADYLLTCSGGREATLLPELYESLLQSLSAAS